MHWCGAAAGADFLEEQTQWHADQAQQGEEAEVIDVGEESRLSHERLVHRTVCLLSRRHDVAVRRKVPNHLAQTFSKDRIVRCQMRHHRRLVRLRSTREHRRHHRNPKTAAHVSHEVVYTSGVANLFVTQRARRHHS